MGTFWNGLRRNPFFVLVVNFLLAMGVMSICRFAFYLVNSSSFPDVDSSRLLGLMVAGLRFDLSACIYLNALYLVMMAIPFPFRENNTYQKVAKWVYCVPNIVGAFMNSADMVYYQFTNRRTNLSIFSEFSNDGNIGKVILTGLFNYWYATLFFLFMAFILVMCYYRPDQQRDKRPNRWLYYALNVPLFAVVAYMAVIGVRGGFGKYTRPLAVSNSMQYVQKPEETAVVLNTPFCVIRTAKCQSFTVPSYFATMEEAERCYTPLVDPKPQGAFRPMNVVVIIMESFGKEYMGLFNRDLDGGTYKGYTPFLDSLFQQGYTFNYSYANGRKSIDAMPSVLASIPMFVAPYITTPYAVNSVVGMPGLLKEKGYYSAFFHGAPNGSMGFQSFAKSIGFDDYYGMTEFGDDSCFDGIWAIWDDPFFGFFAETMDTFQQPFMTAIFSASSHDPFRVPEQYADSFPKGKEPIHQCIGYSDMALRHFFSKASKMDWYANTLFVFTADHTNQTTHEEYMTQLGRYEVPILFYCPSDSLLKGRSQTLAQQIDIMPTVLSYLNYDKPYVAFGQDCLSPDSSKSVVMYNAPFYQYLHNSLMLSFDGDSVRSVYDFQSDRRLSYDLHSRTESVDTMEMRLKAMIQQYMHRMVNDELTGRSRSGVEEK